MANIKPLYLNADGVFAPAGSGDTVVAGAFSGNGSALTALNASNLGSGTVPDARFPATLPAISGENLTSLDADALASGTLPDARFPATLPAVSGANLTSLNASNLASGTVPDSRFPATLPVVSGVNLTSLNASNLASGTLPDARFPATLPVVSGANLTSLDADELASGTVPNARFPATLPAISGANLTNLDANNLTSGTVDTARISGNYTGITGVGTIATGTWQGTAITDTYLAQITAANKVADSALTSNVALLNRASQTFTGTSPEFTNPLTVGAPTLNGHAATKSYVDTEIAAVSSGLDYKQEAKWYWNLANNGGAFDPAQPATKDGFLAGINAPGSGVTAFTAGDRILLNDESATNTSAGIWVFGGVAGSYTLARASDFASGSATGAWIYCLNTLGESGALAIDSAYVCNTQANVGQAIQFILYSTIGTISATAPITYAGGVIGLNVGAGLTVPGSGGGAGYLNVKVDGTTVELNGSNQIGFKSLPANFKIDGVSTSGVTASDLNLLTGGTTSNGASQHRHASNVFLLANTGSALTTGKAVVWNGTTLSLATNVGAGAVAGIVVDDPATGTVAVANSGVVRGVGPSGNPSIGDNIYVLANGALGSYGSVLATEYVTKVGRYLGTVDGVSDCISIQIQEFGIKP